MLIFLSPSWLQRGWAFCTNWCPRSCSRCCARQIRPTLSVPGSYVRDIEAAAHAIGMQIRVLNASSIGEIDAAFATTPTREPPPSQVSRTITQPGHRIYRLDLDAVSIEAMLEREGLLSAIDPSHTAVEAAITIFLQRLCELSAE